MSALKRIGFIGNYLPRHCGIATFTHDLHKAVTNARQEIETGVIAMNDGGRTYDYSADVRFTVRDDQIEGYVEAAKVLNANRFDVVSLQHEYGIFGGEAGKYIIELMSRLEMPIVTTLHTILAEPSEAQRAVLSKIIELSEKLVVMSQKGHDLLRSVHNVPSDKIIVIPHGIPDHPFVEPSAAKERMGFTGREVILTFGLLSPSKGIETVIDAMPKIVAACPDAHYVVLGATHPHLKRERGELYRHSLIERVRELGMGEYVTFVDKFVDQSLLLEYISMCDVYVTPYLNEAQMTSGTLSYSFGLGKAVVSTPYWHAAELLSDGRGSLVPFGDVEAIGVAISKLLTDVPLRQTMRRRAYAESRSMTWAMTSKRYLGAFASAQGTPRHHSPLKIRPVKRTTNWNSLPDIQLGHFLSMCDATGMLQHAVFSIADRSHGYCVDDNARALLLACAIGQSDEATLPSELTGRFAAFIQHAWNPDNRRFRNFMSYDRRWLESTGSEDSHARTLWALGVCASSDVDACRRRWASALFKLALPVVEEFSSPRAFAFTLLGLDAISSLPSFDATAKRLRNRLAARLVKQLAQTERENWIWFEDMLAYDNARLPQALLQTGMRMNSPSYIQAGLSSLRCPCDDRAEGSDAVAAVLGLLHRAELE